MLNANDGMQIIQGERLAAFLEDAGKTPARAAGTVLQAFLRPAQEKAEPRSCLLHGLPGTGRRSMLKRELAVLPLEKLLAQTAWVQCPLATGEGRMLRYAQELAAKGMKRIVFDGSKSVPRFDLNSKMLDALMHRGLRIVLSTPLNLAASVRAVETSWHEPCPFVCIGTSPVSFRECGMSLDECIRQGAPFGADPAAFFRNAAESVRQSMLAVPEWPSYMPPPSGFAAREQDFHAECWTALSNAAVLLAANAIPGGFSTGSELPAGARSNDLPVFTRLANFVFRQYDASTEFSLPRILAAGGILAPRPAVKMLPGGDLPQKDWSAGPVVAFPGLLYPLAERAVQRVLDRQESAGLDAAERERIKDLSMGAIRRAILKDIVLSELEREAPEGWSAVQLRSACSRLRILAVRRREPKPECILFDAGTQEDLAGSPLFDREFLVKARRTCGRIAGKCFLAHGPGPAAGEADDIQILPAEGFLRTLPDSLQDVVQTFCPEPSAGPELR